MSDTVYGNSLKLSHLLNPLDFQGSVASQTQLKVESSSFPIFYFSQHSLYIRSESRKAVGHISKQVHSEEERSGVELSA